MYNDKTPIYELLMLEKPVTVDELGWPSYGRSENVGFYYEEEIALKAARENWCDIHDGGVYNAIIVQKKVPGLYPMPKQEWYFIYDKKTDTYKEAKLPKGMQNFSIV